MFHQCVTIFAVIILIDVHAIKSKFDDKSKTTTTTTTTTTTATTSNTIATSKNQCNPSTINEILQNHAHNSSNHPPHSNSKSPNIILILADDLGYGDLKFNNPSTPIQSPNLNQLALSGIILDRFYAQSPTCSPTRGSILTGRHGYRYGIFRANRGSLPSREKTINKILKKYGYITGHFGKWHLGTLSLKERDSNRGGKGDQSIYSTPWNNGFDATFATESRVPLWHPMRKPKTFPKYLEGSNIHFPALREGWNINHVDGSIQSNETNYKHFGSYYWSGHEDRVNENVDGNDSQLIMDRVIKFIQNSFIKKRPFFTNIWFHSPHLPVVVSQEYTSMYSGSDLEKSYYGVISAMDEQIGRLMFTLKNMNIIENTFISFTSDNGPEVRTPGSTGIFRGRKRTLFEGGLRVPNIMFYPNGNLIGGHRINSITCSSDYMPTIINGLLQLNIQPVDEQFDGINILPLLLNSSMKRHKPLGFQSPNVGGLRGRVSGMLVWMDGDYKLVGIANDSGSSDSSTGSSSCSGSSGSSGSGTSCSGSGSGSGSGSKSKDNSDSSITNKELHEYEWFLYNLELDPGEMNSIVDTNQDKVHEMKDALKKWQESCQRSNENRMKISQIK